MKAVILAGGKGTRVRPLTYMVPKPAIPIIEKPIMSYLIGLLKEHNFTEIVVTVGYLANMIEDHYKNGADYGVHIAYSLEGKLIDGEIVAQGLGSAGGLKKVQDYSGFFDEPFLVICGDALIDLDLTSIMNFHKEKNAIATVVLKEVPKEEVYRYGVVVLDEEGRVKSFQEKPKVEEALSNKINTGIYIFSPEIFDLIPKDTEFDIGKDLLPKIVEKGLPFYGVFPDFQWIDVGTTKDFFNASMMVIEEKVKNVKPYGKEVKPGIWMGINCSIDFDKVEIVPPVYIGGSTKIEDGAKIVGPTMIGSGCVIKSNAIIEKSIVFGYTKVNSYAHIIERIIAGKYLINPFGVSLDIEETDMNFLVDDARKDEEVIDEEQKDILMLLKNIQELEINK